jgi:hypothetical protein
MIILADNSSTLFCFTKAVIRFRINAWRKEVSLSITKLYVAGRILILDVHVVFKYLYHCDQKTLFCIATIK